MKKTLLFLLLAVVSVHAQIVNIPDPIFKAKLLSASPINNVATSAGYNVKIDTNNDGQIQVSEALLINNINVESSGIQSLEGIQSFSNLAGLVCNNNNLTELNLGMMSGLQNLSCIGNDLTSLNLQGLPSLAFLSVGFNNLTTIDVTPCPQLHRLELNNNLLVAGGIVGLSTLSSLDIFWTAGNLSYPLDLTGLTNLTVLDCGGSNLTTIDLTPVPNLWILSMANNLITTIDLSPVPHLGELFCEHNLLASLDVSVVPELVKLYLDDNPLPSLNLAGSNVQEVSFSDMSWTSIDLSGISTIKYFTSYNTSFTDLDFSGQPQLFSVGLQGASLQSLNIKNGNAGAGFGLYNCPNLAFICADEAELPAIQSILNNNGYTNCSVSSYCSFTPGGIYNTIAGSVRFDANNDGCQATDYAPPYFRVGLSGAAGTGSIFTNVSGNYTLPVQQNNTTLTPILENPEYFTVSPSVTTATFVAIDGSSQTKDFCVTANGIHSDVEIVIATVRTARPGFDAEYSLVLHNKGNTVNSGQIDFIYDESRLDFIESSIAAQQSPGQLVFDYTDLNPFETRSINMVLNVNAPTEIPAVNIGDILPYTAQIAMTGTTDEVPQDNNFALNQAVIGALDPNNKICLEGDYVPTQQIGKYLHYVINFENVGNAPAENIVVKDMIDAAKFDLASLQMLSSSHSVQTRINGNKVEFIFEGIQLGAGQHGHVVFKIKTKSTLAANAVVTNKADIFFDYNFPVTTNTATTTFELLSTEGFVIDQSVSIAPNPAGDWFKIQSNSAIQSVQLFDVNGRILSNTIGNDARIDVSQHAAGIYFVRIKTDKGVKTEKLIKK